MVEHTNTCIFNWRVVKNKRFHFLFYSSLDMKHLRFIARTVLVENNQVDQALKSLTRILSNEKVIETSRRWQSYEKPFERRNRLSFQKCMTIYASEIDRKVRFIVRKNRDSPYPWD